MPSREIHDIGGIAAGAVAAGLTLPLRQLPLHDCLELLGGVFAGLCGSRLPDILDPPSSPNHRDLAHGIAPVTLAVATCWQEVEGKRDQLRAYANALAAKRASSNSMSDAERLLSFAIECLCRVLVGALIGAPAGYLSHVALDAFTPRGLPLVAAGT